MFFLGVQIRVADLERSTDDNNVLLGPNQVSYYSILVLCPFMFIALQIAQLL